MSKSQNKKNVVSRSMRLRELSKNLNLNETSFNAYTQSIPVYSSYYNFSENNARYLCYELLQGGSNILTNQTDKIPTDPSRYRSFDLRDSLKCGGYRAPWTIYKLGADGSNINVGNGYLFYKVFNTYTYYPNSANGWVNNCATFSNEGKVGKGVFAVLQTASQINSYNDPKFGSQLGSISQWLFGELGTQDNIRARLSNLYFDEDIFYVTPQECPLTFVSTISLSYNRDSTTNVKIVSFIGNSIKNTSSVPTSEFEYEWIMFKSSDNSVAELDTIPFFFGRIPTDTITFKQSGTFILYGTVKFYQSKARNVAFYKKDFAITVNLTIFG